MSSYRTETTEDEVKVLFFVASSEVEKTVEQVVSKTPIQAEFVNTSEQGLQKFLKSNSKDSKWYKIFLILDIEKNNETLLKEVFQFWKTRPELTYVLMHSPFSFKHSPNNFDEKIGQRLHEISELINQISPYTSIFYYKFLVFAPLYSVLQQEFKKILSGADRFSLASFSPISLEDVVSSAIKLSYSNRGGQRKTIVGEKEFFLESLMLIAKQKHLNLTLSNPEQNVITEDIGEIILQPSSRGEHWADFFDTPVKENDWKHSFTPSLDIPKPKKITGDTKNNLKKPTTENLSLKTRNLLVDEKIQSSSQIKVISTTPVENKVKNIVIPVLEAPTIKRSHLILQSLEEHQEPTRQPFSKSSSLKKNTALFHNNNLARTEISGHSSDEQVIDNRMKNLFYAISPQPQPRSKKDNSDNVSKSNSSVNHKKSKNRKKKISLGVLVAVLILFFSCFSVYFYTKSIVDKKTAQFLITLQEKRSLDTRLGESLSGWSKFLNLQLFLFGVFDTNRDQMSEIASVGDRVGKIVKVSDQYHKTITSVQKQVFFGKSNQVLSSIDELSSISQEYYLELAELENEVVRLSNQGFFIQKDQLPFFQGTLAEIRRKAFIVHQISQIAPGIVGGDSQKQYAIVIQDETELRPSGGVIKGVILVTFENGKIVNTQSFSEQEIDKLIGGEVESPKDFSLVFNSDTWTFKDTGWSPDFSNSAQEMLTFLQKTTAKPVNGVIATTSKSLSALLGNGGVVLGDESFTEENMSEKYLSSLSRVDESENLLFKLAVKIFESYQQPDSVQLDIFWNNLNQLLDNGDIQVYIPDQKIYSTISALGWSGEIVTPPCPTQLNQESCRVFTVYQVDANVNKNNTNAIISKSVQNTIVFQPDQTMHKYIYSYESGSKHNSYPYGNYKSYSRLYLSKNVSLKSIAINGNLLNSESISNIETESRHIIGYFVEVPPGEKVSVEVELIENPIKLPSSYAYFIQKQPGENRVPTVVTFKYESNIFPSIVAPEAIVKDKQVEFRFYGDQHVFAGAKFRDINQ